MSKRISGASSGNEYSCGAVLKSVEGHADFLATRIVLRRQVLDWRDHWSIEAQVRLLAGIKARSADLAAFIQGVSHKDLALMRTGYAPVPIIAELIEAATKEADALLVEASDALSAIVTHHLEVEALAAAYTRVPGFDPRQLVAFGKTAGPIAAAAGLGLALPGLATTSSVAFFGLVTTSTVSMPILAAGIGGVALLGGIGVFSLKGVRTDQERRLRNAINTEIEARLFAPAGKQSPSLLARIEAGLARAARELTGEH